MEKSLALLTTLYTEEPQHKFMQSLYQLLSRKRTRMAFIKLARGKQTEVDDDLFEELNQYKWSLAGPHERPRRLVRVGNLRRGLYIYHAVLGITPWLISGVVHHIDHDVLNNKRANLQLTTYRGNNRQKRVGLKGGHIHWDSTRGVWRASKCIYHETWTESIYLGQFSSREAADVALEKA
jgi:hypothetical protein